MMYLFSFQKVNAEAPFIDIIHCMPYYSVIIPSVEKTALFFLLPL